MARPIPKALSTSGDESDPETLREMYFDLASQIGVLSSSIAELSRAIFGSSNLDDEKEVLGEAVSIGLIGDVSSSIREKRNALDRMQLEVSRIKRHLG